ncbi:flagellar hook-length control protein FliK [Rheinheimera salexigens]|uniref:Flagellar hook-length control protein-like C-terminal domain-containing protein n=1 Tax=Rheinheimera salexigens TaxID=1628148 RepID=A0A1E7Q7Y0_9GAMM|nr:flagellar hook-length control protein FliK [Rheinheimera salexigens]OEY70256.1 hypothetical protein BI198_12275 [Rheinheimera salexigens]
MNEIKLPIPSLASTLTLDKPALKLLVAQVYQAQLQQLSSGAFSVQVPSNQGPLQIPLPANFNWVPPLSADAKSTTQSLAVQIEFLSQDKGLLNLAIKSAITNINLPISLTQSQQITLALSPSMLQQALASTTNQIANAASTGNIGNVLVNAAAQPTAAVLNASVSISGNKLTLQLANLAAIPLSSVTSRALGAAIQRQATAYSNQHPIQLIIRPSSSQLQLVPSNSQQTTAQQANTTLLNAMPAANVKVDLSLPEHQAILQQLRHLVNQQAPTLTLSNQQLSLGKLPLLQLPPQANSTGINNNNYQAQIQLRGNQWLLQLSATPINETVTVASDKLNQTIQLIKTADIATSNKTQATTALPSKESQQQSVQQAWRQLLPLLAPKIDPLAESEALDPVVSKVLALIRQGQPDGNKVLSSSQLNQQLSSLLQFQPLQASPNLQTGAGTLALAIQLLLGSLQQKATAPANQAPTAQRLATLIGQLDPSQTSGLLRQLGTHSSAIQQSQLNMLDSNSNQQLVLQLPLQQGQQSVLNQMSIEQREASNQEDGNKQKQWRLTMKFDLQQLGRLLVVATLQQQELQLQFYAEQAAAQRVTEQFLPLLKARCQAQGIEVNKAECVLGVIPDSLIPRTNSLVTIRV